jgi:hypothetical protein
MHQWVLHNPKNDRRTTKGVFHIAEGGLPVPDDKSQTPLNAYAELLRLALSPPDDLLCLPFTSKQETTAKLWLSLLIRPIVAPEIPGRMPQKTMETRIFAPGGLIANLDL